MTVVPAPTLQGRHDVATSGRSLPALDGLRAVGALMVLVTHVGFQSGSALAGPFAGPLARLDAGVAVFFVVSGFLLFRPHVEAHLDEYPRPRTLTYLWHRFLRIFPVLALAVTYAAVLVPTPGAGVDAYLRHLTLTHIYVDDELLSGLTQMWSLATEVAFYLLLPVAAMLVCRGARGAQWTRRALAVLAMALPLSWGWLIVATTSDLPRARMWLPALIGWFAIGMMLAVAESAIRRGLLTLPRLVSLAAHPGTAWALALSVFAVSATHVAGPLGLDSPTAAQAVMKNLLYGLFAGLLVLPAVIPTQMSQRSVLVSALSSRPARFFGQISYGIFAYHVIVLGLVERYGGLDLFAGHFWSRLIGTVVVTTLIATVSFYWMERPIMTSFRMRPRVSQALDAPRHSRRRSSQPRQR